MNFKAEKVVALLKNMPTQKVNIYVDYLKRISTEKKKNSQELKFKFMSYADNDGLSKLFEYVHDKTGMFIDGEYVTIEYRGGMLRPRFDYNAYKNAVMIKYPETTFDMSVVRETDVFSFSKESGRVYYQHKLTDAFNQKKNEIIGAYCITKNERGEFLEIIDRDDIKKFKAAAISKDAWTTWESRMILKSVIKRACKTHFDDITSGIDAIDNENNDPSMAKLDIDAQREISETKSLSQMSKIYKKWKGKTDEEMLVQALKDKKEKLMSELPKIKESDYPKAIKMLEGGKTIQDLRMIWVVDDVAFDKLYDALTPA